jgi:hypothetical protein
MYGNEPVVKVTEDAVAKAEERLGSEMLDFYCELLTTVEEVAEVPVGDRGKQFVKNFVRQAVRDTVDNMKQEER